MLKSTHRLTAASASEDSLPTGWTEHKAPTGHSYYYNSTTKQSTYTRPVEPESVAETPQIDYNAFQGSFIPFAGQIPSDQPQKSQRGHGNFTGGRSYQDRDRRQREDRPKSKKPIPGTPWVLVMTKFKRRFVHNAETDESFWKFPQDVMLAVIEMERNEREEKEHNKLQIGTIRSTEASLAATPSGPSRMPTLPNSTSAKPDDDSDSYEEVEVTDDEGEASTDPPSKRLKPTSPEPDPNQPVEFNEDDIAYQLAALESDYDHDVEEDEEDGLPLTIHEATSLFKSLLDDTAINPYHPWDSIIETSPIVDDDRYTALPTSAERRRVFDEWAAERIQAIKVARENESHNSGDGKENAVLQYLAFLSENATPKLYWPEFRRKYKKEGVMRDADVSDKEREKLYRDFVGRVKAGGERGEVSRAIRDSLLVKKENENEKR